MEFSQTKSENATLKAELAKEKGEVETLKAKVSAFEAEKGKVDATKKATDLIENAITGGKLINLSVEDKAKLIASAVANYDASEVMIKSMKAQKTVAAASIIEPEAKGGSKGKTYEWLANNAPDELTRMFKEEPELFNKLSDEHIESKKASNETK